MSNHYSKTVASACGVTSRFVRKAWQGKQPHSQQLKELLKENGHKLASMPTKQQHDKQFKKN